MAILLHSLHLQISLSLLLLPWSSQTLHFFSLSPSPLVPSQVLPGNRIEYSSFPVNSSLPIMYFAPTSSLEPTSVQSSVYSSLLKVSETVPSSINFLKLGLQNDKYTAYTSMHSLIPRLHNLLAYNMGMGLGMRLSTCIYLHALYLSKCCWSCWVGVASSLS